MKKVFILLSFLITCNISHLCAFSDSTFPSKWGADVNFQIGKAMRSSAFIPQINGPSCGGDISFFRQTGGKKDWEKKMHYPRVGGGIFFLYHQNSDTVGDAYAAYMFFDYPIYRHRIFDFNMKVGFGVAYSTRIWNAETNNLFYGNGSHLNFFVYYRLGMEWKVRPGLRILTGATYTHYSNGSVKLPNLGMNTPAANIGLVYYVPGKSGVLPVDRTVRKALKYKNAVYLQGNVGLTDVTRFVKDKSSLTQATSLGYSRFLSHSNKLSVGSTLDFNFGYPKNGIYGKSHEKLRIEQASTEWSIHVTEEILIGHLGMYFQAGAYLYHSYEMIEPFYFRVGVNLHFREKGIGKQQRGDIYMPLGIRAHMGKAHHPETGLGGAVRF